MWIQSARTPRLSWRALRSEPRQVDLCARGGLGTARRAMPRRARASSEVLVHLSYQTTPRLQMQRLSVSDSPWLRLMPRPLRQIRPLQELCLLVPLLATRPTRRRWLGLLRCYLLTLQIPPRLSVLGLLPPIISMSSPAGHPFWCSAGAHPSRARAGFRASRQRSQPSTCHAYLIRSSSKKHTYPELDSGRTRARLRLPIHSQSSSRPRTLCLALRW